MRVEAAKSISLEAIVGGADVSIIRDDEVVLSLLVHELSNHWPAIGFGELWQVSGLQEFFILLHLNHVVESRTECLAHLGNLSLMPI